MKTPTKCPSTIHTTSTIHDPRHVVACHRPHVVVAPEARRRGQRGWTPDAWRNTLVAGDCPYLVGGIPTPLKNDGVRQLGLLFPRYGTIKHVPNHQPVIYHWYLFMISCTCSWALVLVQNVYKIIMIKSRSRNKSWWFLSDTFERCTLFSDQLYLYNHWHGVYLWSIIWLSEKENPTIWNDLHLSIMTG